jgi:hypothetical protein
MRILMMLIVTLGMISPTFAGVLSERDRENQWFQNCEEEIARPFCGTSKINLAVDALAWQWQKPSTLETRGAESPADRPSTTSYLAPDDNQEALSSADKAK